MKKQDLKIEIGELYQLKPLNSRSWMFERIPKTYEGYNTGYEFEYFYSGVSILDKYVNYYDKFSNKYIRNEKYVVVAKEIKWLKYRSSKIKSLDEQMYLPLIEVYSLKTNEVFYVKPLGLDRLKNGNTLEEDSKEDLNNFKSSLLKKIRSSK